MAGVETRRLEGWEIDRIARKIASDETRQSDLAAILRSHDLLRWNGDLVRFASPDARIFYAANYLARLRVDEVGRFLDHPRWDDTLLAFVKIAPEPRVDVVDVLVRGALDRGRVLMALRLFLARPWEAVVGTPARDSLMDECTRILKAGPANYMRSLVLQEIYDKAMADRDDLFKFELLQTLDGASVPFPVLRMLAVNAKLSAEQRQSVRTQICRVLAGTRVERSDRARFLEMLVEGMADEEPHIPAVEYLLLAVSKQVRVREELSEETWQRVGHLVQQCRLSYEDSSSGPDGEPEQSASRLQRELAVSPVLAEAVDSFEKLHEGISQAPGIVT